MRFVPGEHYEHKDLQPLRYVAVRIRKRQEQLFADGTAVKHFAVVTNIGKWTAVKLLEWHREKAGTIEGVHDVLKNELAAGFCLAAGSAPTLPGCAWRFSPTMC